MASLPLLIPWPNESSLCNIGPPASEFVAQVQPSYESSIMPSSHTHFPVSSGSYEHHTSYVKGLDESPEPRRHNSPGHGPMSGQLTIPLMSASVGSRKRIQVACTSCRRIKQRCDGQNPCKACKTRHEDACTYENAPKRRTRTELRIQKLKEQTKQRVQQVEERDARRIQELEERNEMGEIGIGWQQQAASFKSFDAAPQPDLCRTSPKQPTTSSETLPAPTHKGNPISEELERLRVALRPKASALGEESAWVSKVERNKKDKENVFAAVVSGQCQQNQDHLLINI